MNCVHLDFHTSPHIPDIGEKFNKEGYSLVAMDIVDADKVTDKFEGFGDCVYVKGNLACGEDRANLVSTAIKTYGRIDVLVNVAGVAPKVRNDILEMTEESYDFVMGINTKGTLFLTQAVANEMITNEQAAAIENAGIEEVEITLSCS